MLSRVRPGLARNAWKLLSELHTPNETLATPERLNEAAAIVRRNRQLEQTRNAAQWFADHPGDHFRNAVSMSSNPHVSTRIARLAELVTCDETDGPILPTQGVLRVAARFTGTPVDKFNRMSDGRMAIARLVGGSILRNSTTTRAAHAALIEISATLCRPALTQCEVCPLESGCSQAQNQRSTATRTV